jgi:hypothetical protein
MQFLENATLLTRRFEKNPKCRSLAALGMTILEIESRSWR